jgi:hypothetical protein
MYPPISSYYLYSVMYPRSSLVRVTPTTCTCHVPSSPLWWGDPPLPVHVMYPPLLSGGEIPRYLYMSCTLLSSLVGRSPATYTSDVPSFPLWWGDPPLLYMSCTLLSSLVGRSPATCTCHVPSSPLWWGDPPLPVYVMYPPLLSGGEIPHYLYMSCTLLYSLVG